MSLSDIKSREAILAAVREFNDLGEDTFLAKYGYGRARRYFLEIGGRLYPSKAIIGVAHGYEFPTIGPLDTHDFKGGETTVAQKCRELGFSVRVLPSRHRKREIRALLNEKLRSAERDSESVTLLDEEDLRQLLITGDPDEGIWVAWTLGRELGASIVPELTRLIRKIPSPITRRHLVVMLAGYGEVSILKELALEDPDESVRATACQYLTRVAETDQKHFQEVLINRLLYDDSRIVRQTVLLEGIKWCPIQHAQYLEELTNHPDPKVRKLGSSLERERILLPHLDLFLDIPIAHGVSIFLDAVIKWAQSQSNIESFSLYRGVGSYVSEKMLAKWGPEDNWKRLILEFHTRMADLSLSLRIRESRFRRRLKKKIIHRKGMNLRSSALSDRMKELPISRVFKFVEELVVAWVKYCDLEDLRSMVDVPLYSPSSLMYQPPEVWTDEKLCAYLPFLLANATEPFLLVRAMDS